MKSKLCLSSAAFKECGVTPDCALTAHQFVEAETSRDPVIASLGLSRGLQVLGNANRRLVNIFKAKYASIGSDISKFVDFSDHQGQHVQYFNPFNFTNSTILKHPERAGCKTGGVKTGVIQSQTAARHDTFSTSKGNKDAAYAALVKHPALSFNAANNCTALGIPGATIFTK